MYLLIEKQIFDLIQVAVILVAQAGFSNSCGGAILGGVISCEPTPWGDIAANK
jgi:hypothetical protein